MDRSPSKPVEWSRNQDFRRPEFCLRGSATASTRWRAVLLIVTTALSVADAAFHHLPLSLPSRGERNANARFVRSISFTTLAAKKRTGKRLLEGISTGTSTASDGEQDGDRESFQVRTNVGRTNNLASKTPPRSKRPISKSKSTELTDVISPALAQWAKEQQKSPLDPTEQSSNLPSTSTIDNDSFGQSTYSAFEADVDLAGSLETKTKERSTRREKQAERKANELHRERRVQEVVQRLEQLVDGTQQTLDIEQILAGLRSLREMDSTDSSTTSNSRIITAGASLAYDYRLAWAGSDDAVCHVGTGLHKVPLARLQEVFWTCGPRQQLQMLEVIRILGPFPNVKNVLRGTIKIDANGGGSANWKITWSSLVDGTGKEILAGTADNVRRLNVQVLFWAPSILVVAVPSESGADPLDNQDRGRSVLLFLRENSLAEKLESLRVT